MFLRDARCAGRAARGRRHASADARRRRPPSARLTKSSGALPHAQRGFLRREGRPRSLAARRAALAFEPAPHPALHPGRSARVLLDGRAGRVDRGAASALAAEVRAAGAGGAVRSSMRRRLQRAPLPAYREVPKFPAVSARSGDDLSRKACRCRPSWMILRRTNRRRSSSIGVFDVYRGPGVENGKKSLAFRVLLQDTQKTLTDAEVESAVAQLVLAARTAIRRKTARLRLSDDADQGRSGRSAVRKGRAEQARSQGHGGVRSSRKSAERWKRARASSSPASAISSCATSRSARAAIPRPAKRFRSPHAAS